MKEFNLDQIIDFLSGRLRKEERAAFEKERAAKPESREEALTHQAVLNYIDQSGDLETKEWLNTVLPKYQKKKSSSGRFSLLWMLPVATVAAMLLLFFLPALLQPEFSAVQLGTNYLEPYEMSFGDRGQSADVLLEAGQAYQAKKYEAAIPLLRQAVLENKDGKYQLALGISLLEAAQSAAAIDHLQKLISSADPVYLTHAQWYLALAYLQQNDAPSAKLLLQALEADPQAFNHEKAKTLLQEKIFFTKK